MDRTFPGISRLLTVLLFASCTFPAYSQVSGTVVDEQNEPVFGAFVSCGSLQVQTDASGKFQLPCTEQRLSVFAEGYDTLSVEAAQFRDPNFRMQLSRNGTNLGEVEIKAKMLFFDIGYLPPIKGVQIATGTSSIIQTETQGGAKSTGNPRELFAKVPGLNIWESDGAGIQMGVGGRGLSPNRAANFNMRQNGYDISADALGYPESYYTPPIEALSAIEIIRGSASLQYGTQFGGLMNFVLKNPAETPFELTTRNTYGSYGYFGTFNRVSGTSGRFEYQAYYQLKTGDGYRDNSSFTQHQGFAQLGYHLNEKHHLRLEYTRMSYLAQQPGGLSDMQFEDDPTQSIRGRNWFKVDWNVLALHYDWELSSSTRLNVRTFGMLSQRLSLGFLGQINKADPGGNRELIQGDFQNAGAEARFLHRYKFDLKGTKVVGAFLAGARYYRGQTTSVQGLAPDGRDADFRLLHPDNVENSSYTFPSENIAGFLENIWFVGEKWTVNAGVRLEHIASASEGFYKRYVIALNQDTIATYRIEDSNALSRFVPLGGVGGSFRTGKLSSAYANVCMNYRAINFTDIRINNPNIVVDTNIRDEYGYTAELGWRGFAIPYLYTDVALFYLFYGNKIGLAPQGVKKVRTNIGDAVNMGVELFAEFDYIKAFNDSAKVSSSVFVNVSFIDARYVRSLEPNYIGRQVEYVSPVLLRGGIKVRHDRWQIQVQGSYNSPQFADASNAVEPSGDAVIGEIPAYFVVDFSARYALRRHFQFEAGVNNLLNASYYTRRATAYPGPGILPSDGINFYATLQFKIGTGK